MIQKLSAFYYQIIFLSRGVTKFRIRHNVFLKQSITPPNPQPLMLVDFNLFYIYIFDSNFISDAYFNKYSWVIWMTSLYKT